MDFAATLASAIDTFTTFISIHFSFVFDTISFIIQTLEHSISFTLMATPQWLLIVIVAVVALLVGSIGLSAFSIIGLTFIAALGLWAPAMSTLSLVLASALLSLIIGIPLGILISESKRLLTLLEPVLDFMQTMPPFVLLIPAVLIFGVGTVPGVVATIFFAMPLPVRFTAHGLTSVEKDAVEAGEAFGANRCQILFLIKLPLAAKSIMAGVNQCVMMCLSMVIIASMIGAGGLGDEIMRSISRLQVGRGVLAGLAVVILAILIDRLTKRIASREKPASR
ncbi:ABC transporter permease subunit [Pseudochrobactrum sp. B5]|uniref:ABC transporter permease n=1 Tax=Pseudochrobactrum sp. B5 TaxID=1289478 RepID=UPI000953244B|nr:ABC transporter permease subunit [Pseudochrobactrum sp. B5]